MRQEFPKGVCRLDLSQYKLAELTHAKEDASYYPIVISIEALFPASYKGRAKKSTHFTYGVFALETDGSLRFKFIQEKLLYNKYIFKLSDIYGKDNTVANNEDES